MKMFLNRCLALFLLSITLASGIAVAQETTATISGTVKDETGAVVPSVTVEVKNVATGISRSAATDGQGRYTVPQLVPGNYEIQASSSGFQTFIRRGIELTVGRHATVDVELKVGAVTQTVEIVGEAPLVNTTSAATSGLIGDKEIRELPLNGRNFVQLTLLEPGVVQSRSAGSSSVVGGGVKLNFNGARMDANNYIVDGTTANSVNQQAIGGASGQAMGVEAIQEFQVLASNYSAEFGRGAGGVVNVVSKSGTNDLHGTAFEFLRNDKLDARNFFDGADVPAFKRNQFGGSLGGPIMRDKMFVFGAYEGLRERLGRTLIGNVPTAAARLGNLPTGSVTVAEEVKPYLPLWPLPTPGGRDFGDGRAEFIRTASQPTRQDYGNVRVDHNFSGNDSLFVRYTIDDSVLQDPQTIPNYLAQDTVRSQYATIGETRIFSPQLLNVFRFGFNRSTVLYDQFALNPLVEDPSLWFFPNPSVVNLGAFGVSGLSEPGGQTNRPKHRLDNVFQFVDTVNYNSGNHSWKFGGEFQRIQTNEDDTFRGQGVYTFANLANFLRNQPATFLGVKPGDSAVRGWRQSLFSLFVQDDVRIRPTLTLNLGFRWEFVTNPTEVNGRAAHYEGVFTTRLGTSTVIGNPLLIFPKKNFSPRFGFAWDVAGDGKTSVRGGFGVYQQMLFRNYFFSSRQVPPWYTTLSANAPNLVFPRPLSILVQGGATAGDMAQYEDGPMPYMMQWNLSVQREVVSGTVLGAGYVGTRGLHLGRFTSPNVAYPEIQSDGRYFYAPNLPRRDPNFTSVNFKTRSSESRYNALQVKATRRFTRGLQAQAAYTWSHSLDLGSAQLNGDYGNGSPFPQNPWNIKATENGHSAFDLRHVISLNYTYALPFGQNAMGVLGKVIGGWQTNGILSATSGVPLSIEVGGGLNRSRQGVGPASRPNLRPGMSSNPIEGVTAGCLGVAAGQKLGGPDLYYDPCAFELQELGYYGNLGRNTVIGPGLTTFDFALVKNTSITEGKNLQFRWEVFNLFNHANFSLPNGTAFLAATGVASGNAGRITTTVTSSRQMQFGLKFSF